jgi:adenine-specific DNA-methyltransferase
LLLKLGLDLCVEIQSYEVGAHLVYVVGDRRLIACLSQSIDNLDVEELGKGIAELHTTDANASESICVFRDAAFTSDLPKANMMAILQQAGLKNVRSV